MTPDPTTPALRTSGRSPEQVFAVMGPEPLAERLRHIQSITDAALAHLTLDDLLRELLLRLRSSLAADVVRVLLCTEEGNALSVRASLGLEGAVTEKILIPLGQGLAGRVAMRREAVIVDDVSRIEVVDPAIRRLRSAMVAPLLVEGQLLGVVKVGTLEPRSFNEADLSLLQMAADRVALAIDRARRYEEAGAANRRQEEARAALGESEERFRLLVQSVQDYAIFMLDPEGRVVSWNRGAERIKGYSEEEVLGQHFSLFYTPADVQRGHPQHELEIAAREGRFEEEGWRVRKDGSRFWANVVITALRKDGELVGFAKVTRDLTQRREAEQARENALVAAEAARAAAEEANRTKSAFMATMSHELRTPLNAVLGYTELLLLGVPKPLPDESRGYVERLRLSARHLLQLIEEMLTFTRIEAGREEVDLQAVAPEELLQEVTAIIEPLAAKKGLTFRTLAEQVPARFATDPRKLRQILLNLLGNAVKFTEQGEVELRVAGANDQITFQVRDTGIGIAEEYRSRLFEAFWQANGTLQRLAEGAGLGLAIAERFVRMLSGTIEVESTPGQGSTFTVRLPLVPPAAALAPTADRFDANPRGE